ncbi:MAG TPA: hypothetical protein DG753_02745 [Clostridium sp.]|nr:hypothetical protein [Clostridium sp.]
MSKRIKLRIKIENLRRLMHEVIEIEENLLHWRVIKISQELDILLNEYNKMLHLYV